MPASTRSRMSSCRPSCRTVPTSTISIRSSIPRRDALAAHLNANGVQTAINYPTALPFLAAINGWASARAIPNACADQSRILSLPMFAEITNDQLRNVIDLVRGF